MPLDLIALDADDTLWHCETHFRLSHDRFCALLAPFADRELLEGRLDACERRNLATYGYGAKGFTLSMIETALEVSEGRVSMRVIGEILACGREMLAHPVEPLDGVAAALERLAGQARLVLVTKGDLFHQEAKLAASGLGDWFAGVEIVSEKTADVYARVFGRYGAKPERSLMAGNSVRSDVLPALAAGAWAALIPYPLVWAMEAADAPADHPRYRELETLAALPGWIDEIG